MTANSGFAIGKTSYYGEVREREVRTMANPVMVEVTRGGRVESAHRGAAVVVDGNGQTLASFGDTQAPVFPRSAVKAMQTLLLVESGAADRYGFQDRELALASASHTGEPAHVQMADAMLKSAGLDESALECGTHWPSRFDASLDLARHGGSPSQLHNNCSGKHAGFLCAAVHLGIDPTSYVEYDHEIQVRLRDIMDAVTGTHAGTDTCAVDGCSIPTYATPLEALATGMARMASGKGLDPRRAAASRRILEACMAEPFFVAGTGRACTRLMQLAPGRLFAKTGAEGVFCAALPRQGLGIALKIDDGAGRAAEAVVAALLSRLLDDEEDARAALRDQANPPVKNRRGRTVGSVRVAAELIS